MKIAYLMNQHPYASCTFIRREIAGLEASGISVTRFSIRNPEIELVDPADCVEAGKTRYVLRSGVVGLLMSLALVVVSRPLRALSTAWASMRLGMNSDRGVLIHLAYLVEACVVYRWCRSLGIAHIHAHFATNATTVAMFCRMLGGPTYSFTVHGPDEFDRPEAFGIPVKIARAAFVVAISHYTRSQLCRWSSYEHWSKIHVVHCGVDELFLGQPVTPIPGEARLVNVGRFSKQKGQLVLVEAAARLARQGMQFKVVLIGDGPMRGAIESLIRTLNLERHVELAGWKSNSEVHQAILASRAMVLPSFAEGLPVVIMESLALGRPVISTYVAGIPELVEPGVTGWLVPAGCAESLAQAMREVVESSSSHLEQMGRAGATRVAQHHSAAIEASKLALLFEQQWTGISAAGCSSGAGAHKAGESAA